MNSYVTMYRAKAHTDDLLRQAKKAGAVAGPRKGGRPSIAAVAHGAVTSVRRSTSARQEPAHAMDRDVTIRFATAADDSALRRLAQLDCCAVPPPPLLIAKEAGEIRAALSVLTSDAIADPFHPAAALVELLRMRGAQVRSTSRRCEQVSPTSHTTRPRRMGDTRGADRATPSPGLGALLDPEPD
jgi:hypothetical protein